MLHYSTYKLSDCKFKTPRISPILKSAKIKHFTVVRQGSPKYYF